MKERTIKVVKNLLIVGLIGMLYAVFSLVTKWRIPCLFKEVTHLDCPGCGITRMCLSLLRLDFYQAFRYNPGVFLMIPLFVTYFIVKVVQYIKNGVQKESKVETVIIGLLILYFVGFGIVRNLPGYHYLLPTTL